MKHCRTIAGLIMAGFIPVAVFGALPADALLIHDHHDHGHHAHGLLLHGGRTHTVADAAHDHPHDPHHQAPGQPSEGDNGLLVVWPDTVVATRLPRSHTAVAVVPGWDAPAMTRPVAAAAPVPLHDSDGGLVPTPLRASRSADFLLRTSCALLI